MKFKDYEGSLKRALLMNYPGCSSALEAFDQVMKTSSQNQRSTELPLEYESMRNAINDIANALDGYNIDLMDQPLRKELADMPLKSVEDIEKWKQSWRGVTERLNTPKVD